MTPTLPRPADQTTFVRDVKAAAGRVARGNGRGASNLRDKVLTHYAWREYQRAGAAVTLPEFKRRLSAANGQGIDLAHEDLIPEERRAEFADAEVRVSAWCSYHWIRI